ncbi:RecT protein [Catenulispora acidiphila DSM 44928]|uniref:RecT protein n=1 Tax=Catenulispora acidiphila (strain DSM 44928 / JCM 14897 / NBRC 102108 / NRRL B-24433 / ID139908) TaxID=479433 RepID=C7Q4I7_CATAD|nr:recombinase RecT [Catenulispora acidiphila]ACU71956.1 RecT protein [Catenulispora acidiphila DSM 44928]
MTATTENTTASTAVATRDNSPGGMVKSFSADFAMVLPSHIKPETWVRLAQGALKKGKKVKLDDGSTRTELEIAANNNPAVFLSSLLDAARLGLEPGTEQYYLTPRSVKGQLEILGIVGYQGYIELMYRAGAISSVVAECVYANDAFTYKPGVHERPLHDIDWDLADRGALRLVYAYAVMGDGATSKVVVLNRAAILKIKDSSQGANSNYSPWKTHEPAMWLKSAVRQLAKWVPTSSEYMRERLRAAGEVASETAASFASFAPTVDLGEDAYSDESVVDGEIVDDHDHPGGYDPECATCRAQSAAYDQAAAAAS